MNRSSDRAFAEVNTVTNLTMGRCLRHHSHGFTLVDTSGLSNHRQKSGIGSSGLGLGMAGREAMNRALTKGNFEWTDVTTALVLVTIAASETTLPVS